MEKEENLDNLGKKEDAPRRYSKIGMSDKKAKAAATDDPFYESNVIPGQFNYQPTKSPDQEVIEKEEGEIREKIDNLAERMETLGSDDLIRPILLKRFNILHQDLGHNKTDAIKQEIMRLEAKKEDLESEVQHLSVKDEKRMKQQRKIEAIDQVIAEYRKDLEEPKQMAA